MNIDVDLLKQFRETVDWFIELPNKLVSAVMGLKVSISDWRNRIAKTKEIAELREIGKCIQSLYFYKGNALFYLNRMQRERSVSDLVQLRAFFDEAIYALDCVWVIMSETPLSNKQLGAEVALELPKAKLV